MITCEKDRLKGVLEQLGRVGEVFGIHIYGLSVLILNAPDRKVVTSSHFDLCLGLSHAKQSWSFVVLHIKNGFLTPKESLLLKSELHQHCNALRY